MSFEDNITEIKIRIANLQKAKLQTMSYSEMVATNRLLGILKQDLKVAETWVKISKDK